MKKQNHMHQIRWKLIQQWFHSDLGKLIYQSEKENVEKVLESCFGLYILQFSSVLNSSLLESARIHKKCIINCYYDANNQTDYISEFESLAIKSNSVDTVVLFHTLEFSSEPHQILREVDRVLVAGGKLIIVSFNPFSLFGLWRFFLRLQAIVTKKNAILPCDTKFIAYYRIKDWLSLLGFSIDEKLMAFVRPPINNAKILQKFSFMEEVGERYWPFISSSFILLATKQMSTLTPVRKTWLINKKQTVGQRVPEASNLENHEE